jgi:hypothetical protein
MTYATMSSSVKFSAIAIIESTKTLLPSLGLRNPTVTFGRNVSKVPLSFSFHSHLNSQPFDRLLQNHDSHCGSATSVLTMIHHFFCHIAPIHAHILRGTIIFSLTATLLAGQETTELLKTLGFTPGTFFFQRRSNIRREVQDIYRVLRHDLSGWTSPDVDWIIKGDQKTHLLSNYALCLRLRAYITCTDL